MRSVKLLFRLALIRMLAEVRLVAIVVGLFDRDGAIGEPACLQEQLMVALTYNFGGQVLSSLSLLNCTKQSYKRLITNSQ